MAWQRDTAHTGSGAGPRQSAGARPHVVLLDPFSAGLAIARASVRLRARVTVIAEPGHDIARHSRGVHAVVLPFEGHGERWLAALAQIAARERHVAVLPATDRTCELLLRHAARLPTNVHAFERSGHGHGELMDKERAHELAQGIGVAVPWCARVSATAELPALAARAPWPCVVKPVLSHVWRERYGEERAFLVHDATQASGVLERPLRDGVAMMLCQYVPGGDDHVEEAIVVRLADGSYPVAFGCHKLRQFPPGFGTTTVGEAALLPETMEIARRVLDCVGFVGVAGVETKRHSVTGERWFLEVNVRVPAQWGLGDTCGVHATERLLDVIAGHRPGPQPPLRGGVRFALPDIDVRAVRATLKATPPSRRPAAALRMARAYAGVRDLGMIDPRDPAPALAYAARVLRRRFTRARG